MQRVFETVTGARDAAIERVTKGVAAGEALCGYHVDDAARGYIESRGYAGFFTHRTGHSIGTEVHGNGANMDNFENHDERRVIPLDLLFDRARRLSAGVRSPLGSQHVCRRRGRASYRRDPA